MENSLQLNALYTRCNCFTKNNLNILSIWSGSKIFSTLSISEMAYIGYILPFFLVSTLISKTPYSFVLKHSQFLFIEAFVITLTYFQVQTLARSWCYAYKELVGAELIINVSMLNLTTIRYITNLHIIKIIFENRKTKITYIFQRGTPIYYIKTFILIRNM